MGRSSSRDPIGVAPEDFANWWVAHNQLQGLFAPRNWRPGALANWETHPAPQIRGVGSEPGSTGDVNSVDINSVQDRTKACDRFLIRHRFHATKSEEIFPGDIRFDVWLDDHLVNQGDVQAALLHAIPKLENVRIWLAHFVRDKFDSEMKAALAASGAPPRRCAGT